MGVYTHSTRGGLLRIKALLLCTIIYYSRTKQEQKHKKLLVYYSCCYVYSNYPRTKHDAQDCDTHTQKQLTTITL